jgi:hypothetical protein
VTKNQNYINDLAKQISRVRTVGLGRPLRRNAEVGLLLAVCKALAADSSLPTVRLFEDGLSPSIARLGNGEQGQLARLEFGLHSRTENERFLTGRRHVVKQKLGLGDVALERLEHLMDLALAQDLVKRLEESGAFPVV